MRDTTTEQRNKKTEINLCDFFIFALFWCFWYRHCHCCCMRNSLSLFDLAAVLLLLSLPETHDPTYTSTNLQYSQFFCSFCGVFSSWSSSPPSFALLLHFTLYIFYSAAGAAVSAYLSTHREGPRKCLYFFFMDVF